MIYRMRFTSAGTIGAVLFVGANAMSAWESALIVRKLIRGFPPQGIIAQPTLYALCAVIGAIGFVMMLQGREIITPDELPAPRKRLDL